MTEERVQRRLAAILAADMVGYSRLMGTDERGTIARHKSHRKKLIDPAIEQHNGRIVKTMGDGLLAEFGSVVDAVECAVDVQRAMADQEAIMQADRRISYRVGINLGDIVIDGDDILGDGVNIAARMEALADPGGVCLAGAAYDQVDGKLELSIEDLGEHAVKNIKKPIRVYRVIFDHSTTAGHGVAVDEQPASAAFDKPSIAVLPFDNMSGDSDQEYFADGITDDLITALSRFRSLVVIARNSTFVYKSRAVNVGEVGRKLGVRYVVEGSVRRSSERVRVTVQLVEAHTGNHLWAERYDRGLADIFAVQDEVTEQIASTLMTHLEDAERQHSLRSAPKKLSAYHCCLRAKFLLHKGTKEALFEARTLLERAIDLDPDYAAAYAELAESYFLEFYSPWNTSPETAAENVLKHARTAADLDPHDSRAHLALSWAHLIIGSDYDLARMRIDEALRLNPNDYDNYCFKGWLLTCSGELDDAVACSNEAFRRSPLVPDDCLFTRLAAEYLAGNYVEAIRAHGKMLQPHPNSFAWLAAAYAQLGRTDEAHMKLKEFFRGVSALPMAPERSDRDGWVAYWTTVFPSKDTAAREHLCNGLRKAGMSV